MVLVIGKFACLVACYFGGLVGGVFWHELGHAVVALLVTRQKVELEIGAGGTRRCLNLGRLELVFRTSGHRYGATRYERSRESRGTQVAVALGGPLASVFAVSFFTWLMVGSPVGAWAWVVSLGLTIANFRILIVAVWPIEYRPLGEGGAVWLSDGLDIWRLLSNKRD